MMRFNGVMHGRTRNNIYTLPMLLVLTFILLMTACTETADNKYPAGTAASNLSPDTQVYDSVSAADSTADKGADNVAAQAALPLSDVEGCSGAVFSSGGRLYVYDAKSGSVSEIDEASGKKHFLGLSPDRKFAAWLYSFRSEDSYLTAEKIGIYEMETGRATELVLSEHLYQLMSVSWTSGRTIMAVGHLNPSTDMCQAFDAGEGRSLFVRPVGRLFDVSPDGSRIIYYFTQHFSEAPLPPHLRISGVNTEDPDASAGFDGPVYEVGHEDDRIGQACFAGENKIIFIEYISGDARYNLKLAEIKEDSIEIVSEMPFSFAGLDVENMIAIEYFDDSSKLYIISRDGSSASAAADINLHEFLLKDSEITRVNTVPTGLDASFAHDIVMSENGNGIIITDTTGSGYKVFRKAYRYDGKEFTQILPDREVSDYDLCLLEEYAGEFLGTGPKMEIDGIEIY
ncbi:MAG TPA: hypothetical protein PK767_01655 [Clostridiales bacterium]|nr:hypothetical protein [Clostridiales bacterium]